MYDFIYSFLKENNFQINKERTATVYYKYLSDLNKLNDRVRLDVLIQDNNLITISETLENHKDNSESQLTICRLYKVNTLNELKYLFLNNNNSDYWLLSSN